MDIYIYIKENSPVRLAWMCPFLPRIGEHLYIDDFCPNANTLEDILVVQDVQWHIVGDGMCASLFMGYDPIETNGEEIKSLNLN